MTDLDLPRLLRDLDRIELIGKVNTSHVRASLTELAARLTAAVEEAEALRRTYNGGASRQVYDGLRADLAAAREEVERLRREKGAAATYLAAVKSEAVIDLARFRAALTDPAAVEAVAISRHVVTATGFCATCQRLGTKAGAHRLSTREREVAEAALRAFAAFVDEEADR